MITSKLVLIFIEPPQGIYTNYITKVCLISVNTRALHYYLHGWRVPGTPSPGMCTYEPPGHTWYQVMSNTGYQGALGKSDDRVPGHPGKNFYFISIAYALWV